ncbi:MAG: hypothetical protein IBX47_00750 [Desulfuromonadales bacterium]|nr:hypothetical protein [Desulfuromonadales bacterium]
MNDKIETETVDLTAGLAKIRSRRWLMWLVIFSYVPGLLISLEMQASSSIMGWLFALWVLLLCIVIGLATVVCCPRCKKPFHTNGPTFLPVRKCVHCGLHLKADKIKK